MHPRGATEQAPREEQRPAAFEKKTLIDEPKAIVPAVETVSEPAAGISSLPPDLSEPPEEPPHFSDTSAPEEPVSFRERFSESAAVKGYDLSFLDSINLPLPDIDPEYLEHVDDPLLDNAFDERLMASGDDLMPIRDAANLVAVALNGNRQNPAETNGSSNGNAAEEPARKTLVYVPPTFDDEPDAELPVLSENPTEEELFAYASAHPVVKKALRIFRGTIVEVKKR